MILGFIGTGKISSSIIFGIFRSKLKIKRIYISSRNRNIAKKLSKSYGKIKVLNNNQEIIFSPNANFIYLYVQITDVLGNTFLPASGITLSGPEPIRLFYGQYFNGSTKAKWETTEQEGFYSYTLYG